jgi:nucleotide-binding universal stress UspA family protein
MGMSAVEHDVIVLGRESLRDTDAELAAISLCVDRFIRDGSRPILLLPEAGDVRENGDDRAPVLLAFDGSVAASRMLHMFALLAVAAFPQVHVLTMDNSSETAASAMAEKACTLLRKHGLVNVRGIGLGDRQAGTPAEAILGTAKALGAGTIAMGGYGHSGIREVFGSCTREVLAEARQLLFLHH